MTKYTVYVSATVSTAYTVDADSPADAQDAALDMVPGLIFVNHTYPYVSDWEADDNVDEVTS